MEAISGIFAGSDNLFKYLFTLGVLMYVTAVVYPLEKEHQLDLDINLINQESKLNEKELISLRKKANDFQSVRDDIYKKIEQLQAQAGKSDHIQRGALEARLEGLKKQFNLSLDSLQRSLDKVETKELIVEYAKKRVSILDDHLHDFDFYRSILTWVGATFAILGLSGWIYATIKSQQHKNVELKKAQKELLKH